MTSSISRDNTHTYFGASHPDVFVSINKNSQFVILHSHNHTADFSSYYPQRILDEINKLKRDILFFKAILKKNEPSVRHEGIRAMIQAAIAEDHTQIFALKKQFNRVIKMHDKNETLPQAKL